MADELSIGFSEAVRSLRAELADAVREGAGEELRFRVGPVELEFQLQVGRERGGQGGVRFWVVSAEAKGGATRTETHCVRLTLAPVTAAGTDVMVSDEVLVLPK